MNKKMMGFLIVLILLIISLVFIYIFLMNNQKDDEVSGEEIYMDEKVKSYSLNYEELMEDIKSIKESGKIKNAKFIGENKYQGDGYVIYKYMGGEVFEYVIYYEDILIWEYNRYYPQTSIE